MLQQIDLLSKRWIVILVPLLIVWFYGFYLEIGENNLLVAAGLACVKHCPLPSYRRNTLTKIFQTSIGLCVCLNALNKLKEQLVISSSSSLALLVIPSACSGCSSSSSAATAHCVAVSGVRPSAGGWRPASTASPLPPVLQLPNSSKVIDLRLKTAVKHIDKPLE